MASAKAGAITVLTPLLSRDFSRQETPFRTDSRCVGRAKRGMTDVRPDSMVRIRSTNSQKERKSAHE
jgi:hypothetical protein